jgi:molecular chaperone DnaK
MPDVGKKSVGIDLGTTFSAIAHVNQFGKAEIIANKETERITPSVILFDSPENIIVGSIAKQNAVAEPDKIVEFVKREMGKGEAEYFREFHGKKYTAETLSAFILKKLKQDAEESLGTPVTDAVVTCPAYFNDAQRSATENAGKIAGFNVLQVLNEPTAAAIAFGVDRLGKDQTVFVFDLGGGTFDVTVMRIEGNSIRMVATNGDHMLGGKDWDDALLMYVSEQFKQQHGDDPLEDLQTYQDLQMKAIQAKHALTRLPKASIVCSHQGKVLKVELTQEKFAELSAVLMEKCRTLTKLVLEQDAGLTWPKVDTVLLVGGSTRMPMVRKMLAELSGKTLSEEVNPDEAVAIGAALQGAISTGTQIRDKTGKMLPPVRVRNVTSHSIGMTALDRERKMRVFPILPRFTEVPGAKTDDTFITMEDGQRTLKTDILEGESTIIEDCTKLGDLVLGLPPGLPAGTQVAVTFELDESSILHVTVRCAGKEGKAEIKVAGGLTDEQVKAEAQAVQKVNIE